MPSCTPLAMMATVRAMNTTTPRMLRVKPNEVSQLAMDPSVSGRALDDDAVEDVKRMMSRTAASNLRDIERSLTFLATTASTSPFIGLFGTVWGIMDAFHGIGKSGSASLAVVAPGISEALVATAIGLIAAIPAVIAYNHFLNKVNVLIGEMDNFSQEMLNVVQRMPRGRQG